MAQTGLILVPLLLLSFAILGKISQCANLPHVLAAVVDRGQKPGRI